MNITPLFSTPLYINSLTIDYNILEHVKKLEYMPIEVMGIVNGYSSINFHVLQEPPFRNLKEAIELEIGTFLYNQLKFTKDIKFNIQTSWIVKHTQGSYSQQHHHNIRNLQDSVARSLSRSN